MWLMPPGHYRATTCWERELTLDHIHPFLTAQGHGGHPWMSDQLNSGAPSDITRTLKTTHTMHSHIHCNKADMRRMIMMAKWYLGTLGPKASWHLSYRWGKPPKKPHSGNVSRPEIKPGLAAWQVCMLPSVPQRWTEWLQIFAGGIQISNLNEIGQLV